MNREEIEAYEMQNALQQPQINAQNNMSTPQLYDQVQQSQSILVEQTNPKKVVDDIILRLRGIRRTPDGREVLVAEPKMNKIGIEKIWFILDSHINQNVILSHLEASEIGNIMETVGSDLVDNLSLNWEKYGIKDKTDLDDINNSVLSNIFFALKRAEGQNEKNWLGKISVENISSQPRIGGFGKKDNFWSKFKL